MPSKTAVRRRFRALGTLGVLGAVILGCGSGQEIAPAVEASLAIVGVTVLDPASSLREGPSTVLLDGERIVTVGPVAAVEVPPGSEVIDGSSLFLLPGLWDLHTHVSLLDPSVLPLLVTQGVTGVRDLGGDLEDLRALERRVASGELVGPRLVIAGPTLNGAPNAPHHRVIATPEEAAVAVDELREAGVDLLKTHNATARDVYFALLENAHEAGMAVAGHVPRDVSPLEACRAGQSSIEHIATLFEGTYLAGFDDQLQAFQGMSEWLKAEAPELVRCMVEHRTLFVPTLRAYEVRADRAALYDRPDPRWRYVNADLYGIWRDQGAPSEVDRDPKVVALRRSLVEVGQQMVRLLVEAGAPVGAGTDLGVGILPGFGLHREVELLVEAGLTPPQALRAATRGPGATSGGSAFDGRIVPGAPADLVLLRSDTFEDVSALDEIEGVLLRGRYLDRRKLDAMLSELEAAGAEVRAR